LPTTLSIFLELDFSWIEEVLLSMKIGDTAPRPGEKSSRPPKQAPGHHSPRRQPEHLLEKKTTDFYMNSVDMEMCASTWPLFIWADLIKKLKKSRVEIARYFF